VIAATCIFVHCEIKVQKYSWITHGYVNRTGRAVWGMDVRACFVIKEAHVTTPQEIGNLLSFAEFGQPHNVWWALKSLSNKIGPSCAIKDSKSVCVQLLCGGKYTKHIVRGRGDETRQATACMIVDRVATLWGIVLQTRMATPPVGLPFTWG
jgi:hypothetical protein